MSDIFSFWQSIINGNEVYPSQSETVSSKSMCFDTFFASKPTQKAIAYQNAWDVFLAVASLLLSSVKANKATVLLIHLERECIWKEKLDAELLLW